MLGTEHKRRAHPGFNLVESLVLQLDEVLLHFSFEPVEDQNKISALLAKLEAYCLPRLNIPFERYKFYRHQ